MDGARELMLIDTFGTADEDRFWDLAAYNEGKHVEFEQGVRPAVLSTDWIPQGADGKPGSGEAGTRNPPLPPDITKKVSALYVDLFERLTGEKFR